MTEPAASQRELDALARRVDTMDQTGTRGVGVIQAQLTDLARDVAKLEGQFTAHETEHRHEAEKREQQRRAGSRWRISAAIAGSASFAAVLALLIQILTHVR
jgi:hypothetical protein